MLFGLRSFLRPRVGMVMTALLGMFSIADNAFAVSQMAPVVKIQYKMHSNSSDVVSFLVAAVIFLTSLLVYYKVSNTGKYDTFSLKCKKCGRKTQGLKCIACERKSPAK
ncbi:MAG TPA: hypothetical protein VLF17_03375 [Candidatus Nitrosotenuis sp.]|nr:hypothetical protein [Candidatus Nitrosotenuis sp.]